jgi:uncharacterized protein YggE
MIENFQNEIVKDFIKKNGPLFIGLVAIYLVVLIITQVKGWGAMGAKAQVVPTITVTGEAEIYAAPDVAEFRVNVSAESKDRADSVTKQAELKQKFLAVMNEFAIDAKDYKTEYITTNPKYEWKAEPQIYCITYPCPQPGGKQVITGYTTDEALVIKVRNIDNAGKIYEALVKAGAQNVSGPNMTIDDEDALRDKARKEAIMDAKQKAKVLARDLGVRIVRVNNFAEGSNGYPMPMYAGGDATISYRKEAAQTSISVGENKIISNVTITYEIR